VLKHLLPEFSGVDLPFALERNPPSGLHMGEPPGHSAFPGAPCQGRVLLLRCRGWHWCHRDVTGGYQVERSGCADTQEVASRPSDLADRFSHWN